jgi:hypothetical protein
MHFRCMLHIFQLDVAKVDLYRYVANVCLKCFSCFKRMLQVFHLNVAYIVVIIHVYCKCVFQMFQLFHLDVACFYLDVHMLQWLYTYVASVYSKCFTFFIRMLQVFYLDVAYVTVVIHICCKHMFELFHLVSVCCNRCPSPHPSSAAYLYHAGQFQ